MFKLPSAPLLRPLVTGFAFTLCPMAFFSSVSLAFEEPTVCVLEASGGGGGDRLSLEALDSWTWEARPGDRVRCDLEAHEPLDAACLEASCSGEIQSLLLLPGRVVELQGPHPKGPVEVEWRRFGAPGDPSMRIAQRQRTPPEATEPWLLHTAAQEYRLLRLRQAGGAPETFFIPAVPSKDAEAKNSRWSLRPGWPDAGGEVFGFAETGDFRPVGLSLEGLGTVEELTLDTVGQFGVSGLRPGRYHLQALFQGGWRLDGPALQVEAGKTTELLPWELPRNGAVEVDIEPKLCEELEGATSWVLEGRRDGTQRLELGPGCVHRLEGLPPGEWTLTVDVPAVPVASEGSASMRRVDHRPTDRVARRPTASAFVTIEAGTVATVTLERPRVVVEGEVIVGGQGLPGMELRLVRPLSGTGQALDGTETVDGSTHTDGEGAFRLEALAPGPAVLQLHSEDGYPVVTRDVDLSVGANRYDFDLGEGQIRVHISSADGDPEGPVTLEVWGAETRRLLRTGTLEPDQGETLVYGLDLGRYELSAFTEGGLATLERPQVELTKEWPREEAQLVLERRRVVATVLDPNGLPVPNLLVAIDQRPLAETGERPGEYSLLGASAGSELRVVPSLDHVPVCRMLERIEPVDITLRPAGAHALLIPPAGPLPPLGTSLGMLENLPGSNCAMPVSLLWRPVEDSTGRTLVRLDGLPHGTFLFRNADGVVIVQVPGPPVPMPGVE